MYIQYMLPGLVSGFRVQRIHCTVQSITLHYYKVRTVDSVGSNHWILRQPDQVSITDTIADTIVMPFVTVDSHVIEIHMRHGHSNLVLR